MKIRIVISLLVVLFCTIVAGAYSSPARGPTVYLPLLSHTSPPAGTGWIREYHYVQPLAVTEGEDGSFVAVGSHYQASYPGAIFKIDANGSVVWLKVHQLGQYGHLSNVHTTATGDFIAVGAGPNYEIVAVVKHRADGTVVWQRSLGVPEVNHVSSDLTSDGGLILAGGASYTSFVWRMEADGNLLWQKELGDRGNNTVNSVIQMDDGTFVAAGQTTSAGAGNWEGWVTRLDANGDLLWQKVYGTAEAEFIEAIQSTTDGGLITAGWTWADKRDGWVMKLDAAGQVEWSRGFDRLGNEEFHRVLARSDGTYLLAGKSSWDGGQEVAGWHLKLAADGTPLWQHAFDRHGALGTMHQVKSGGMIMTGPGTMLRLDNNGFASHCTLLKESTIAVADMPLDVAVYPYGPGPANHTSGGIWYVADETLSSTLLCPEGSAVAGCEHRLGEAGK